ncbi:uncharacterized protein FIBRA_06415 [Fibroporia radiculosa]|uniref:NAD-dependent epimerase/dehydratase domain-containing protein n=1 Tax=Fibroporia radiculosa TaxID=599839 RepID=J4GBF1_9APHY|nr:uncharacterized protein FIBRA_06415 [Fibroporia radiculosa]CCM04248.1 predicted protein [Fibroporia radiculosa]
MPTVSSGRVLVTGANGYIAIWVVRRLLEQGYTVRGTVRSESKAEYLHQSFAAYGNKFETVVVEDITKLGAFDEAVKGMDAIEHVASPMHFNADDPDELIVPAVNGTTSLLESARVYGASVKRIVFTSSCAALMNVQDTPRVFTEADWNEQAIAEVREKGRAAAQQTKYRASKTLAERAAWNFMEKNKDALMWDLVVINPPQVYGPMLHEVPTPGALNASMHMWYSNVIEGSLNAYQLATMGSVWVEVRDLADAHVLAIQKPEAGGERIIVSAPPFKWQDWLNAARACNLDTPPGNELYDPAKATHHVSVDTSKAAKLLGMTYRSPMESARDIAADLKTRGFI